ncbi:MAG: hypothetical protein JJU22_10145 [Gammaproteobacteria bacterium]|nr:hypothetical protein [Gammaproteobacteria bacterium]
MNDITGRLQAVREQVAELAKLARDDQADTAQALAGQVDATLKQLAQELPARQGAAADSKTQPRAPRQEVMVCPRCALRSLHFEKGSIRPAGEGGDEFEALYRCRSCGFTTWEEVR